MRGEWRAEIVKETPQVKKVGGRVVFSADKLSRELNRTMPGMTDMVARFKILRNSRYHARLKAMAGAD